MTKTIPPATLVERAGVLLGDARSRLSDNTCRKRPVVRMRWAIMWVLHTQSPHHSLRRLGRPVGVFDHSSVHYALQRSRRLIEVNDAEFVGMVDALKSGSWRSVPVWIERPSREVPACLAFFDMIPMDNEPLVYSSNPRAFQVPRAGGSPGDPLLPFADIDRRRVEVQRERAAREAACIAAEQVRYGVTRQTRCAPLSRQVA